jgi:hypothetical protein
MTWTKDDILKRLEAETPDARLVYRALQALYARQTADEQATLNTSHRNGMGFNGFDAPLLSDIAQKSQRYGGLTPKQTALVAKKLRRYAGQLAAIAAEKSRGEEDTTGPHEDGVPPGTSKLAHQMPDSVDRADAYYSARMNFWDKPKPSALEGRSVKALPDEAEEVPMNARETILAAQSRFGFLNSGEVKVLATDPDTRLMPLLVRMGGCRFTAPAQDVSRIIDALEAAGDYCRDVALARVWLMFRHWFAFEDLKPGDRFRFVYGAVVTRGPEVTAKTSEEVFTKSRGGWFADEKGKKFRTGRYSAVQKES